MKHSLSHDAGQVVVEIALFIPILTLIVTGCIDLGRLTAFEALLASSARAGAQYGSLNLVTANDTSGMETAATNDLTPGSGITATAASNFCKCADGSSTACTPTACSANHRLLYVSVTTTGTFAPFFVYFANTGSFPLTSTAVMQVEQ